MNESTRVVDVMSRTFVGVSEGDQLQGTVALMDEQDSGSAVVVRGSQPVGMVTERDVVAAAAQELDFAETPVEAVMSEPVVTIPAAASLDEALQLLTDERIRRLPVLEGEEVVGILSSKDVLALEAGTAPQATNSATHQATATDVGGSVGAEAGEEPVAAEPGGQPSTASPADSTVGSTQGICESCGRFARDLASVDGRVQCGDCRGA
jgi:CBS domain-containing protein